jgi:predicted acetyltransferase
MELAPTTIEVVPAEYAQQAAIANMAQLYMYDFSEFWPHEMEAELREDGTFGALIYLDQYWLEPDREPLLIRRDDHLAGFALINGSAPSGEPVDHGMAEFFVVRRHRRSGTGRAAAHAIFAERPGQWEVPVIRANRRALEFWRSAIASFPGAVDFDERERDDEDWDGWILRFRSEADS